MSFPLNPKLLEAAEKIIEALSSDILAPRKCPSCGETYLSPSQTQIDKIDEVLPGKIDFSDVDTICSSCVNTRFVS
jgi:uncharacterized OB-fold protein